MSMSVVSTPAKAAQIESRTRAHSGLMNRLPLVLYSELSVSMSSESSLTTLELSMMRFSVTDLGRTTTFRLTARKWQSRVCELRIERNPDPDTRLTLIADQDCANAHVVLVGNLLDVLISEQRRIGRTERRVRLGDDPLLFEVLEQFVLRQVRVQLDLSEGDVRAQAGRKTRGELTWFAAGTTFAVFSSSSRTGSEKLQWGTRNLTSSTEKGFATERERTWTRRWP